VDVRQQPLAAHTHGGERPPGRLAPVEIRQRQQEQII
jgi:hypothetical protein